MRTSSQVKQLLYQQELFRARFELRENFLKNFSREIYENIGQVLSLVKLEMGAFDDAPKHSKDQVMGWAGLLGQAIKDLRNLSRGFYTDILSEYGLIDSLQHEIKQLERNGEQLVFKITGTIRETEAEKELILFSLLKEILLQISATKQATMLSVEASYKPRQIVFTVCYKGAQLDWGKAQEITMPAEGGKGLTIFQKAAFINTRIIIKNGNNKTSIKLVVPTT